jgi:hypothetical protein
MEEHEKKVDHHNVSEFDVDTGKIVAKYAQWREEWACMY